MCQVICLFVYIVPSVLWRCWLGGRKGIRPVKNRLVGVLAWLSAWSKVQISIGPSWCHCHSLSLAPLKSRLVLPFWYQLTQVVLEKRPLNGCSSSLHWKHPRFTAFLDSNLHIWLANVTANELGLAVPPRNLPEKFHPDPSPYYSVIVVTDKQINVRQWFHNTSCKLSRG